MRNTLLLSLGTALVTVASSFACSAPPQRTAGPGAKQADVGEGERPDYGPVGLVTIDVQKVFFDTAGKRNPNLDVGGLMTRTGHLFELASAKRVPVFITYEASKSGDHALPPSLASALPKAAQEFIKTTFAATSQPQFLGAIQASGARRLVVIGAETDVCVLQSILGLRGAGYEVFAAIDTLFSEEVNTGPARRRLRQAGVLELSISEAETLISTGGASPNAPATGKPVIVRPLEIGFLLHDLGGLNAVDSNASAKKVRLRELLLISEWFRIPLFAADPMSALAALPAELRALVTRPVAKLSDRPATVTQLAVAGGRAGISATITALQGNADVFLVEDALLGGGAADLEPLYVAGAVPTTYKALWYELTQSVSEAQWPSQQWVTDGALYFDRTKAPEELPPLAP